MNDLRRLPPSRITAVVAATILILTALPLLAHDLFLRPDDFFVTPGESVRVRVLNGNYERSEASVTYDRVLDFSMAGPGGRSPIPGEIWEVRGDTSMFSLSIETEGTTAVAVSTAPRVLALEADAFNRYLESDGIPDVLEARRQSGELDRDVEERYAKHVKAILQVGDEQTSGYDRVFGYPAELIPLQNPYAVGAGGELAVRALVDGKPVANQLVVAGGRNPSGARLPVQNVRTDDEGVARIRLASGAWYVKFIHMVPTPHDAVDYESKWTTLTFGVR